MGGCRKRVAHQSDRFHQGRWSLVHYESIERSYQEKEVKTQLRRSYPEDGELQNFANETGLEVHVCHFSPGTSKWNKIEHRMFCHITELARPSFDRLPAIQTRLCRDSSCFALGDPRSGWSR